MFSSKGGYILRGLERNAGPGRGKKNPQGAESFSPSPYKQAITEAGLGQDTAERWQIMSWAAHTPQPAEYADSPYKREKVAAGLSDEPISPSKRSSRRTYHRCTVRSWKPKPRHHSAIAVSG
jgi:hypothetical protein